MCVSFIIADFGNYSKQVTQQRATSEYKLLYECLHIMEKQITDDISNTFPDIQDYIDANQMAFAWYHQSIKGT